MSMGELFLSVAGILTLAVALFHLAFWRLFHWKTELPRLSKVNQGILQVLNIQIALLAAVLGFITLRHPQELLHTPLGQALLWGLSLFWLVRTLNQPLFWHFNQRGAVFTALWALLTLLYGAAALA